MLEIFLLIIIIILLFSMGNLKSKLDFKSKDFDKAMTELFDAQSIISINNEKIQSLEERNSQLSKYEPILDAEKKASELIEEATLIKQEAVTESLSVKKKANEEVKELKSKYENILSDATIEAGKIINTAQERSKEIAGEAYEALKNTKDLEKTAEAMRNIIKGYSNDYIIPSYGLLDQLAEEFGYTEAGEELKKVRERTRMMIKNNTAANCEYVESNRKKTAISFVLDAFNGKVDTILSTIKHDNYGKLEQKVKDSFQVVNNLGRAFRNASITEEYLNSRLEELKWGVIVNELKLKEREEQRLIKEQIREEEKARREYERARNEAAKEEEMIKRLMEKAKKELNLANEEQKIKYEQQLKELEDKLKIAEEKNQRALSMSQQTRAGHVYIISNIGSFGEDIYKIGMTRRLEPNDRVKELGDASVPFSFDIHAMIFSDDAPKLESALHKKFIKNQINKVNTKKEFFKVPLSQLKTEIDLFGIKAKWTMCAEAKEYRETLAIEKSLENNLLNQEEWINKQLEAENRIQDENE